MYEGDWANDKANGTGTYIHVNGALYQGQLKDDLQHGNGIETLTDGSKYIGQYATVARMGLVVIETIIVESGRTIRLMEWVAMFGLTNVGIKVNGLTTIWMGWVSIFGPMAAFMKASIQKINVGFRCEHFGLMVIDTKETGTVEITWFGFQSE